MEACGRDEEGGHARCRGCRLHPFPAEDGHRSRFSGGLRTVPPVGPGQHRTPARARTAGGRRRGPPGAPTGGRTGRRARSAGTETGIRGRFFQLRPESAGVVTGDGRRRRRGRGRHRRHGRGRPLDRRRGAYLHRTGSPGWGLERDGAGDPQDSHGVQIGRGAAHRGAVSRTDGPPQGGPVGIGIPRQTGGGPRTLGQRQSAHDGRHAGSQCRHAAGTVRECPLLLSAGAQIRSRTAPRQAAVSRPEKSGQIDEQGRRADTKGLQQGCFRHHR
mmetsp:Transcript_44670/g.87603  ORF Transcript_44670/g.87603 Transcript_44670/m.87603 type:complete len:273 (-) Transcript_44670:666-1484(-)